MTDAVSTETLWTGIAVIVVFPILLILLTEVYGSLVRRGSPAARPVRLLRDLVLPLGALLLLLAAVDREGGLTWIKLIATVFGFLLILLVLSSLNVVLFTNATPGSWRERLPTIFIDLARVALIAIGLAILFSWVWGADVGGFLTALGVTSIVIGLALQNAVGSVVSGLFLLFEQPFQLGDWLDTGSVRGRIVEVNWRATHIDTGNGIQVVPNSSLADSSFRNLSRPDASYTASATVVFTTDDSPTEVCGLLERAAGDLPELMPGTEPQAVPLGGADYMVSFELPSPGLEPSALARLRTMLWYGARRAGLALDGDTSDELAAPELVMEATRFIAPTLRLAADDIPAVAARARLERYAAGEHILRIGTVPDAVRFIVEGVVMLTIPVAGGGELPVMPIEPGGFVGQSALVREGILASSLAQSEVRVLIVPTVVIDELVRARPQLAALFGTTMDKTRTAVQAALAEHGLSLNGGREPWSGRVAHRAGNGAAAHGPVGAGTPGG